MILLDGKVNGFGRLSQLTLDFGPGMNLVFAPNEGGKTTLLYFLLGMLYGQLRPDLAQQRRLQPWVERYRPWDGAEYSGVLRCRLGDGQTLELARTFGREDGRLEILAATGGDLSRRYDRQRNGEALFAETHLGLSQPLFESLALVRENRAGEIGNYDAIRDRIANLAQSGDEDLSVQRALERLEEKLEGIGSDRAPTKPYKQARDLVAALKEELKGAMDARARYDKWLEDRSRRAAEVAELERRLAGTRLALLAARQREAKRRVETLEEIERELADLRAEQERTKAGGDFPVDSFEKISQIEGSLQSLDKYLGEAREDREKAAKELERLAEEQRRLETYDAAVVGASEEEVTGWFVSWLNLMIRRDGVQKNQSELRATADSLAAGIESLPEIMRTPDVDWQRLGREESKEEQKLLWQSLAVKNEVAQAQLGLAAVKRGLLWRQVLCGVLLAAAAGAGALKIGHVLDAVPLPYFLGGAVALAALAAASFLSVSRWSAAVAEAKRTLLEFDLNMKDVQELKEKKSGPLAQAMAETGSKDMEEFLAVVEKCAAQRRQIADIEVRLGEEALLAAQLQAQADEYYQKLYAALTRAGLACAPANLQFQVDALRTNMRLFREVSSRHADCSRRLREAEDKVSAMTGERGAKQSLMAELLKEARVATPEEFRAEGRRRGQVAGLAERETSRTREFVRLAEGRTLPQWRVRLEEMNRQLEAAGRPEGLPDEAGGGDGKAAPKPADIPAAEREERRLADELSSRREENAREAERASQTFAGIRPVADIEEDLALAERDLRGLEADKQALGVALETIRELALVRQAELAPRLNAVVSQRFLRLCRRYDEVRITPEFNILVREAETGKARAAEHLSRGTQDQLYFSLRFGVLELLSRGSEPCPCLLDEPFAAYDRQRLAEAVKILKSEAGERQLVVFTCREDLLELAARNGARIIRLAK